MPRWTLALLLAVMHGLDGPFRPRGRSGPRRRPSTRSRSRATTSCRSTNMDVQDQLAAASPGWQRFTSRWRPTGARSSGTRRPGFPTSPPARRSPCSAPARTTRREVSARSPTSSATIQELVRVVPEDLRFESPGWTWATGLRSLPAVLPRTCRSSSACSALHFDAWQRERDLRRGLPRTSRSTPTPVLSAAHGRRARAHRHRPGTPRPTA